VIIFCIAPGSRSSPLAVAVAEHGKTQNIICYDERSLGFFALGYGKATHKPACVIVSSGTAVANLLPSIIEASIDNIPMIIISADRPDFLSDCGANQTIDQGKIFGHYPRWQCQITPRDNIDSLRVLSTIDYAYSQSIDSTPGPVHINWHFDEPLAPIKKEFNLHTLKGVEKWRDSCKVFTHYPSPIKQLEESEAASLCQMIGHAEKGLIVVGTLTQQRDKDAIKKLATTLKWPLIADVSSTLGEFSIPSIERTIAKINQLNDPALKPDVILQFGGRLVSKSTPSFIKNSEAKAHIFIDDSDKRLDPDHSVTHRVNANISHLVDKLLGLLTTPSSSTLLSNYKEISSHEHTTLLNVINEEKELSQRHVAQSISRIVNKDTALFIGNSMPIRALSLFTPELKSAHIAVNRGTSGIDGNISTACGFALGLKKPLVAFIGDLTFLHDINGLSLLSYCSQPVVIVIANNNGGGIFSFLPIAQYDKCFSPYFDSPPNAELSGASHLFKVKHLRVSTQEEFETALSASLSTSHHTVIEAMTSTATDLAINYRVNM